MSDLVEIRKKQKEVLERIRVGGTYIKNAYIKHAIMLLLDISRSMSGKKIEDAKEAIIHFLESIDLAENEVELVAFGGGIKTCELSRNHTRLEKKIVDFEANGDTPMMNAIKVVYEDFLKKKISPIMVIATDGQPTDATEGEILEYTTSIKNRVRIITIGIGKDISEDFLKKLASSPEDYHFARASFEFERIYKEVADMLALPK